MSDIGRWDYERRSGSTMIHTEEGDWVRYADVAPLLAELTDAVQKFIAFHDANFESTPWYESHRGASYPQEIQVMYDAAITAAREALARASGGEG